MKIIGMVSQWRVSQNIPLTPEDTAVADDVRRKSSQLSVRNSVLFVPLYYYLSKVIPPANQFTFPLAFTINKVLNRMRFGIQPPNRLLYRFAVLLTLFSTHTSQINKVAIDYQLDRLTHLHTPIGRETRYLVRKYSGADGPLESKGEFEWEDNTHEEEFKGRHADEVLRGNRPITPQQQYRTVADQTERVQPLARYQRGAREEEEQSEGILPGLGEDSGEEGSEKEYSRARRNVRRGVSSRLGGARDIDHHRYEHYGKREEELLD